MKTDAACGRHTRFYEEGEDLTVQEDERSGSFVQHVGYGGLRGHGPWKAASPFTLHLKEMSRHARLHINKNKNLLIDFSDKDVQLNNARIEKWRIILQMNQSNHFFLAEEKL